MDKETREKILSRSVLEKKSHTNTLGEEEVAITMKLLNVEVSTHFRKDNLTDLEAKWGMDVESFATNLLLNEMKQLGIVEKIIIMERREKNLNILTDSENDTI
jgi:hypothetical protein